ncbi:hypothetical protein LSUE1_G000043 [Lachnellula suecica]|uniref:G domain-containing protein n=1 Tax=Lachnellula suecica TaxID=602035 RepID=A0A8T9CNN0_9HELO|nr:hypothetical protein LSUE1_G000043 [Lachnellula suecica]
MSSALGKTFGPEDLFVSVMGLTGSGKSSFISQLTKESIAIGHNLQSCTKVPAIYTIKCFGKVVHLIDTPGFDDSNRPDFEVLTELTTWLNIAYNLEVRLSGVIYLHRITDPKMGGAASLNLRTFYKLIGEDKMNSVILATTHWDTAKDDSLALQKLYDREKDLKQNYWAPLLQGGAISRRHDNTVKSAMEMLWEILAKNDTFVLKVQTEMNVGNLRLGETSAAKEINHELIAQQEKFRKEMLDIQKEQEKAFKKKDETYQKDLEREKKWYQKQLDESVNAQKRLQQSAQEQMETKLGEIKTLSDALQEIKSKQKSENEKSTTLREDIEALQKSNEEYKAALDQALAKMPPASTPPAASVTTPNGFSVSGNEDVVLMTMGVAAVASVAPYVFCTVM